MAKPQTVYWSLEPPSNTFIISPHFSDLIGGSPKELPETLSEACTIFSSSDLKKFKKVFTSKASGTNQSLLEVTTDHDDNGSKNSVRLLWKGEVLRRDQQGHPLLISGSVRTTKTLSDQQLSLSQQAAFFQRIMRKLSESIYFKDLESRFILINDACAEKFGLDDPQEAIGKTDFDFFDDVHAQDAYDDEQRIISTKEAIYNKVEKEGGASDEGNERWASTSKLPLYDDNGNIIGTFGITRDISEQKNTEKELKQKEAMLVKLSERVPGFFYLFEYTTDGQARLPFASRGIRDLFELAPEEVRSNLQLILSRLHEEDVEEFEHSIMHSVQTLEMWEIDFRVILPKQGLRWLRGRAKPEVQPDGNVHGIGYITDITQEKKNLEATVRLRKQLQEVIDSAPNLIFIKNLEGKYLMANKSAAAFFDQSPDDIVGKKDVDIGVPKEKAERFLMADKEVIDNNEPLFIPEDKTLLSDGSIVWHQTIKVPFLDTDSGKPAVLSIVTDVTERKRNEIELSNSLDIIGEQNKRLMNFAHIVSHNLRNHAGNISMLLSLYDMEESEQEQQELLMHLNTASQRLNNSIADLNEIIDKQYNTSNDHVEIKLHETVQKIQEILTTEILSNNVTLNIDIPDDFTIEYNPAYIESILLNLMSNAIKYRQPDKKPVIDIIAKRENEHTYLQVSDNGLGIDLDKHGDKLFGMYNTFHENKNSKGIGLFITKNQIESMGGSIEVESRPGKGTKFKITLK